MSKSNESQNETIMPDAPLESVASEESSVELGDERTEPTDEHLLQRTLQGLQHLEEDSDIFDADAALRMELERRAKHVATRRPTQPVSSSSREELQQSNRARLKALLELQQRRITRPNLPSPFIRRFDPQDDDVERNKTAVSLKLRAVSEVLRKELPHQLLPFESEDGLLAMVIIDLEHESTLATLVDAAHTATIELFDASSGAVLNSYATSLNEPSPSIESIVTTASHYLISYCFEVRGLRCALISLWDRPDTNIVLCKKLFETLFSSSLITRR